MRKYSSMGQRSTSNGDSHTLKPESQITGETSVNGFDEFKYRQR